MRTPIEFDGHPQPYRPTLWRAVVRHVVDGDTLDVVLDVGFNIYPYLTIRVANIDTPEIFRPKTDAERERGFEAKAFVEALCLDKPVRIRTEKDETSFGRYVAFVEVDTPDGWHDLGDLLRLAGLEKRLAGGGS